MLAAHQRSKNATFARDYRLRRRGRSEEADVRGNLVADCPATSAAHTRITRRAGQDVEDHDDRGPP